MKIAATCDGRHARTLTAQQLRRGALCCCPRRSTEKIRLGLDKRGKGSHGERRENRGTRSGQAGTAGDVYTERNKEIGYIPIHRQRRHCFLSLPHRSSVTLSLDNLAEEVGVIHSPLKGARSDLLDVFTFRGQRPCSDKS